MSQNKIFFVCPDTNSPFGGIKQIYRQVDVLNDNGFEAYVLHKKQGFKCSWFQNNTKVLFHFEAIQEIENIINKKEDKINLITIVRLVKSFFIKFVRLQNKIKYEQAVFANDDIIVFPEVYSNAIDYVFLNNKIVIYNQNCYYTFLGCKFKETMSPYLSERVRAVTVVSKDSLIYLKYGFPNLPVYRFRCGIDKNVFEYSEHKIRQIAFMTRKLNEDIVQVINLLNFRGKLNGWTFKEIDKMNEFEVATTLKESAFFLSFNHREGFGLPPAEAMACGCIVVGYPGKGGREFFNNDFCFPIEDRDVVSFAKTLEKLILEYDINNKGLVEKGKKASEFILSEYSMEMEIKTILDCWNNILK